MSAEKLLHFIAIILTVISFGPSAAHVFALPNKIGMDQADYFTVQGIYRGWALFGALIIPLFFLDVALAFFIWVFPGNQATNNWTVAPPDWRARRASWEYGHAVNAAIVFLSLCALTAAALLSRGGSRYGP